MKSKFFIRKLNVKEILKVATKQVQKGKQSIKQPRILMLWVRKMVKELRMFFENQKLRGQWFFNESFENGATWSAKTDTHKDWAIQCNIRLFME